MNLRKVLIIFFIVLSLSFKLGDKVFAQVSDAFQNGENFGQTTAGGSDNIDIVSGGITIHTVEPISQAPENVVPIDGMQIIDAGLGCNTGCAVYQDANGDWYYSQGCSFDCAGGGGGASIAAHIFANGAEGSITVTSGESAQITWDSVGATSCTVTPPGWTGTEGSQPTGALSASQTYNLNCTNGSGGYASDSVTVNIVATPLWYCKTMGQSCIQTNPALTRKASCEFQIMNYPYNAAFKACFISKATCDLACGIEPPPPTSYSLIVTKAGTGTGTVTSSPSGVNCGSVCAHDFISGTVVTLTATQSAGSNFSGWSGACSGSNSTCQVTMDAAKSVTATFTQVPSTTLWVNITGGSGTVTLTASGYSNVVCSSNCTSSYVSGTWVTLTATAGAGYTTGAWDDACASQAQGSPCSLIMDVNRIASIGFIANPPPPPAPTGDIKANGSNGPITIPYNTSVTLSWTSSNATNCNVSSIWTGTSNAGQPTPNLQASKTYELNCGNSSTPPTLVDSVTVNVNPPPSITSVSCTSNPIGTALIGQSVTWTANVTGGTPPYTYLWSGDVPSPAPTSQSFSTSYGTIGRKNVVATVTDVNRVVSACDGIASPMGTIYINFNPIIEEF